MTITKPRGALIAAMILCAGLGGGVLAGEIAHDAGVRSGSSMSAESQAPVSAAVPPPPVEDAPLAAGKGVSTTPPAQAPQSSQEAHQPATIDTRPWRRGEVWAAAIVVLFVLCTAASKHDPKRAWLYTAVLTGLGAIASTVASDVTPNGEMWIGGAAGLVATRLQGPGIHLRRNTQDNEAGQIAGPLLVWAACAAIVYLAGLAGSCSGTQRKAAARTSVDCTLVEIGNHAADLKTAIQDATNMDGTIDWPQVKDAMKGLAWDVAMCAARAAIAALLEERVGARTSGPSEASLRGGWERLQADAGRRFVPEVQ